MSLAVAGMLQDGKTPAREAALVKDAGNDFEQALPETLRDLIDPARTPLAPSGPGTVPTALATTVLGLLLAAALAAATPMRSRADPAS